MTSLRLALRHLARAPGFIAVALLTLALGIGANAGVFSFLHALLTRPLPFPAAEELVFISEHSEQVPGMSVAYPNFIDWRERQQHFTSLGLFRGQSFNWVGAQETERLRGAQLTHDLWPTLAIAPRAGRWFGAADDQPGAMPTVLLSEAFADRAFGGATAALDQKLNLSGQIYTVIGVMPAGFGAPIPNTDVWTPFGLVADLNMNRGNHPGLNAIGRLRSGATFDAAQADMERIAAQLAQEHPETNTGNSVNMTSLIERAIGGQRTAAWVAFAAACGVLLIACANVANLLLARSAARAREFAVRAAIGATRAALIRLLLTESLLLGLAGTSLGLLVGYWTMAGIKQLVPANTPFLASVAMNPTVFAFAMMVGVGVTLLFGLVPALTGSKINLNAALAAGGRSGGGGVNARWRSVLIAGEFALTLVLLFVTGLMVRTIHNLNTADAGLQTDHVISFGYHMSGSAWSEPETRTQLLDRALERLRALPGVTHVGFTDPLPLAGGGNQTTFLLEGVADPGPGQRPSTENNIASADYFETVRIPLVRGRGFTGREEAEGERVCLIDTRFAETYFAGEDPVGRRVIVGVGSNSGTPVTIIGVVGHVQNYGIGKETRVQLYRPYRQVTPTRVSFVVRTTQEPAALSTTISTVMREAEPTLPVFAIRTMDDIFHGTLSTQNLMLQVLSILAGLALLLAAIGLYGVVSYIAGQRTREVGIRMALGATAAMVRCLMLGQGLKLAAGGLAAGLLASVALARLASSLLYGVSPYDPLSLGAVSLALVAVGLFASWLPAHRAARVNPTEALRAD